MIFQWYLHFDKNVAFFSAVDVDNVLRKEVDMDCITPSNPHPIPHGAIQTIQGTLQQVFKHDLFADIYGPELPTISQAAKCYTPDPKWQEKSPALQDIDEIAMAKVIGKPQSPNPKVNRAASTMKRVDDRISA